MQQSRREYWDSFPERSFLRNGLVSRIDIIRHVALMISAPSVLEIGVDRGEVLIGCHDTFGSYLGVDIDPSNASPPNGCKCSASYIQKDSHQFWKGLSQDQWFDLVFVDGCHEEKYSYIDISQAMLRLSPHGIVLAHDVNNERADQSGTSVEWAHDRLKNLPGWYVRKIESHPEGMGIYFRL